MRHTSRFALSALSVVAGMLGQVSAHAVALTAPVSPAPFADTALTGTTVAARPELAGVVLEDAIQAFNFQGVTGTVQNRVVREASGTLDFYWKVNVDSSATGTGVAALRLTDFGLANISDADWRIDGLGTIGATTARLFNGASYPTGSVNFLFGDGIRAGESSSFFFLHTNAMAYAKTAQFDLLDVGPQNLSPVYSTFAPAVPEPSSYAMVLAGLAVAGVAMRRRRSQ